ncbi:hypothetical protein RLIN73S_02371 [Rhodanobacter lindaniclasticus]
MVIGDANMLRTVWQNLLGNAVKSSTGHCEVARIEVSAGRSNRGDYEFAVTDNGAGFDMQYVDKLFGVFSACIAPRISRATASAWPTCGASSRAMARQGLGASRAGPGRHVSFLAAGHRRGRGKTRRVGGMNKKELRTVLLVEDSLADAEMAMDALAEAHLANPVVHVEDGVECLEYLRGTGAWAGREPGDRAVVLLDIKMPRMDGLEVLTRMRQDEHLRRIPVVILVLLARGERPGAQLGSRRRCLRHQAGGRGPVLRGRAHAGAVLGGAERGARDQLMHNGTREGTLAGARRFGQQGPPGQ